MLIVEDDARFASILLELARESGFKGVVDARRRARSRWRAASQPDAITLDIGLPDMDGWALLDLLKHDPATRHIPVHVISVDDQKQRGARAWAPSASLEKPVDREALARRAGAD